MDYGFLAKTGYDRNEMMIQALQYAFLDEETKEQVETNKAKANKATSFFDAVNNPLQALGSNTYDLTYNGLGLQNKRNISWQIQKQDTLMRSVPYFDKASSWKATRALINGVDINSKDPKVEDLTRTQGDIAKLFPSLHPVIKWGDFYGGSGGLLIIDGIETEQEYMSPLNINIISKGHFRGVKPLSRLYQIQPDLSNGLVTKVGDDIGIYDANEIGEPLYYRINLSGNSETDNRYFKVHRSRIILYRSIDLTWVENRIEMYFGPSILERCYSDFARYESFVAQVNKLAQRSNIPVLNVKNLPQASLNGQRFAEFVTARIKGINFSASSGNMIVLGDKETEQFKYENATFQELADLAKLYRQNFSASLEAPTGVVFNDSEIDDEAKYLTKVREIDERVVRTWFNKLIPLCYRNRYGKTLKDFDFSFKSLEMPTEKEKIEKMKLGAEMLSILWNDNVIDGESYVKMLKAMPNNVSDVFNEITEAYIKHIAECEDGEVFNKMYVDIKLATALNHLQGQGEGEGNNNLANKVQSAQGGQSKGGDPKETKKPTVKVPIVKDEKEGKE